MGYFSILYTFQCYFLIKLSCCKNIQQRACNFPKSWAKNVLSSDVYIP